MAQQLMNVEQCQELDKLVDSLTTSGQPELDQVQLKKLKNICKQSDDYVKKCYHGIMIQLMKEHAEIRLSSVQLVDVLFNRSHCFRELLLADFKDFMELTIEINADYPLPPPKEAAKILKSKTIEFVHKWHEKFGDAYKKLALGYNFLKNCKKVNFQDIYARTIVEQQREEQRRARTEAQQREKLQKTFQEIKDVTPEIETLLVQAQNCLLLLLPDPDNFDIQGNKSPDRQQCEEKHPLSCVSTDFEECTATVASIDKNQTNCVSLKHSRNGNVNPKGHNPSNPGTENANQNGEQCTSIKNEEAFGAKKIEIETKQTEIPCGETSSHLDENEELSTDETTDEMSAEDSDEDGDEHEEQPADQGNEKSKYIREARDEMMRDHGICSQEFSLTINMFPEHVQIEETPDNADVLQTLKDCLCLIDAKYLPTVQNWLEIFTKRGGEQKQIKEVLDLRDLLRKMKDKICRLRIKKTSQKSKDKTENESDSDSDDEFEEVKDYKEGYEAHIPEHLREEYGLTEKVLKPATNPDWVMPCLSEMDDKDPTTAMPTIRKLKQQMGSLHSTASDPIPSTSGLSNVKKTRLKDVPTVPFGMDLFHWGEKIETPLLVRYDSEHRFWIPNTAEDKVDVNALESMKSRVINYVGKFEPVRWSCRAPLPNGKLCPRRDRYKCPFHGEIIPRDRQGQPTNPEHKVMAAKMEQVETETADWDDPELQADIKAATGIDLSRKGKRSKGKGKTNRKGKQRKYPGLTDIRNEQNPVRKRLENKVLNRNAIKRVAEALSTIDEKKRKDKFGNTFHYVHGLRKS